MSTHVGPYHDVLKASSVQGMLQRKARLADVDILAVGSASGSDGRTLIAGQTTAGACVAGSSGLSLGAQTARPVQRN